MASDPYVDTVRSFTRALLSGADPVGVCLERLPQLEALDEGDVSVIGAAALVARIEALEELWVVVRALQGATCSSARSFLTTVFA